MTRVVVVIAAVLAGAFALVVFTGAGGGGDGDYRVRAIFDNAAQATDGEDVKVAGAVVGRIESLDVTEDRKAALTLKITDDRFAPFHTDARCRIRPEGLLAVKFVECDPGTAGRPELREIRQGDGKGSHLLPVTGTSSPVDLDVVTNVMRKPTGQELSILLSELGTGLAGRGKELNAVIRRANPALAETDAVLRTLARQNVRLARLAEDSDEVLAPLARDRRALKSLVTGTSQTMQATAASSSDIERSIQRLPGLLRELRPLMSELGTAADAGTPVFSELGDAAKPLGRAIEQLEPFAEAVKPATVSLGQTARKGGPELTRALPMVEDIRDLGAAVRTPADNLDKLSASIDKGQGIEHVADLAFYLTNALNGFDDLSHYVRVEVLSGACSEYTAKGFFGCDAQWGPATDSAKPITEGRALPAPLTDEPVAPDAASPEPEQITPSAPPTEDTMLDYLMAGDK